MKNYLVPTLVLFMVALCGCRTTDLPPPGVVYVGGKSLQKKIAAEGVGGSQTETGTRKVWVGIRNKTGSRIMVEARAVFSGDKGEPIETEGAWRQIFIESGTTSSFDATSKSTAPKQAVIQIREGNK